MALSKWVSWISILVCLASTLADAMNDRSSGTLFPKPQFVIQSQVQHYLNSKEFSFSYVKTSVVCDLLDNAFNRYYKIIFTPTEYETAVNNVRKVKRREEKQREVKEPRSFLKRVVVDLHSPCEDYPSLESDESYTLEVAGDFASIESESMWGVLRALETFSQLVVENDDGTLVINDTYIKDRPRFNHRGVLLDTSRHYIDLSILKLNLEAMAASKLNVFHWHIVDDQSFPYVSSRFPEMSQKGAFTPYDHVYTTEDVREFIEFARLRGIRVIVEFDTPGHTQSWGKSVPILTPCFNNKSQPNGEFGPIDPSNNMTYMFLRQFFKEVAEVFPDKYVHLGGDEVDFTCWESNPKINEFMAEAGFAGDYSKLEEYYMQNLLDIVHDVSPGNNYIIWQEVIDNNVTVRPETVIHVWKDGWEKEMSDVTNKGYRTILSTCWYLNYITYGSDWIEYYKCDPLNFNGTAAQKNLVMGGEACMWGEYVDGTNVIPRTWPRTSVVGERLWSSADTTSIEDARNRLEGHRCRLLRRGVNAEPVNGPGYCDYEIRA